MSEKSSRKVWWFLFGPLVYVFDFFARSYATNRARLQRFKSNPRVRTAIQGIAVAILLAWALIFVFAPPGSADRLTEGLRNGFGFSESPASTPASAPDH